MAFDLATSNLAVRETRLNSISGYTGNLETLIYRSKQNSLKNCDRCFRQANLCCAATVVVEQLTCITDIAVVYHTPAGCASNILDWNNYQVDAAVRIGRKNSSVVVCTDLNEQDTVFGAAKSLRSAIEYTWHTFSPKALFIASSCTAAIVGEDLDSIAEEYAGKYPVPVIAVHCEGFQSRIFATGFDLAGHAVMRLVKPPRKKRPFINIITFLDEERNYLTRIFAELGVEPLFFYLNSSVEELSYISEAVATTSICHVLGSYVGAALQEKFGVPYINGLNPNGMEGFDTWLRDIGTVLGKQDIAEAIIAREKAKYLPQIDRLKKALAGKRAVVAAGFGFVYELTRILEELGIEVVYVISSHHDAKQDDGRTPETTEWLMNQGHTDLPVLITEAQNYEITNVLHRYRPDIFICRHPGPAISATKEGIPSISIIDEWIMFGYHRFLQFAQMIHDSIVNQSLVRSVAAHAQNPYTDWWFQQKETKFLVNKEAV